MPEPDDRATPSEGVPVRAVGHGQAAAADPSRIAVAHGQVGHRVRFGWGADGARALVRPGDTAVIVDVLCFTTAVSVAVDAGIEVLPFRWRDGRAAAFAAARGAVLARARVEAGPGDVSLAPGSLRRVGNVARVVLPSPNGSTLARRLARSGAAVVAGCLRNAAAVGSWAAARGAPVVVVAAGERWPRGSLRPAVEDLWGAGAVVAAVAAALGPRALSPEAAVARDAYRAAAGDVRRLLGEVASGLELRARGAAEDVAIAAEVDASRLVPLLLGGAFVPAAGTERPAS